MISCNEDNEGCFNGDNFETLQGNVEKKVYQANFYFTKIKKKVNVKVLPSVHTHLSFFQSEE